MDQNTENVQIDIKYHQIYQEGCRRLILRLLCHFLNHFAVVFGLKHLHAIDFVITLSQSLVSNSEQQARLLCFPNREIQKLPLFISQAGMSCRPATQCSAHSDFSESVPLAQEQLLDFLYSVLAYIFFGSSVARGVPDCLKYQLHWRRGCCSPASSNLAPHCITLRGCCGCSLEFGSYSILGPELSQIFQDTPQMQTLEMLWLPDCIRSLNYAKCIRFAVDLASAD